VDGSALWVKLDAEDILTNKFVQFMAVHGLTNQEILYCELMHIVYAQV